MELFRKVVNDFQPLAIFTKTFCILYVWLGSKYASDDYFLFFPKNVRSIFIYVLSLSIFYWIFYWTIFDLNILMNIFEWTRQEINSSEHKNSTMTYFRQCTLQYNYNMLNMKFVLPCPQIKLHNEIHSTRPNCTTKCTIKFIEKLIFLCVFVLLSWQKIKLPFSTEYSSY